MAEEASIWDDEGDGNRGIFGDIGDIRRYSGISKVGEGKGMPECPNPSLLS